MVLELTKSESKIFYDTISSELGCVVNEYDPDTGRCPSKKRIADGKYAKNIINVLECTQPKIKNINFINLDKIKECSLNLSNEEAKYVKNLLENNIKECDKELKRQTPPFTGVLSELRNYSLEATKIITKLS